MFRCWKRKSVSFSIQCLSAFFLQCFLLLPVASAKPVSVVDDAGQTVTLPRPARTVVSLAPHATELLYQAGAGEQLVGVVEYSDYPEEAKTKPRIGSFVNVGVEKIIDLKPDLVVAYKGGNQPKQLRQLEKAGLTLYRSHPQDIQGVIDSVQKLGVLTGHELYANKEAQKLEEQYQKLKGRYREVKPLTVFIQFRLDPLMTVAKDTFIGKSLRLCGGQSIFPDLPVDYARISVESVLVRKPEVVLVMESSRYKATPLTEDWPELKSRVIRLDENLMFRASGRLLTGTELLCEKLDQVRKDIHVSDSEPQ